MKTLIGLVTGRRISKRVVTKVAQDGKHNGGIFVYEEFGTRISRKSIIGYIRGEGPIRLYDHEGNYVGTTRAV